MYDLDETEDKDLFLIKLPSELIKHQKKFNDLTFDLNALKSGARFRVDNVDYEAVFSKAKVPFSCLCKSGDSLAAVNKFKNIIQIKRVLDVPKPQAPPIILKQVEIPESINTYLKHKKKSVKRLKKSSKNKIS